MEKVLVGIKALPTSISVVKTDTGCPHENMDLKFLKTITYTGFSQMAQPLQFRTVWETRHATHEGCSVLLGRDR